jgi:hypothetical protein
VAGAEEGGVPDDEAPEWPDETVESAMRAEQREREGDTPAPRPAKPAADVDEDEQKPLPQLDVLIPQIPSVVLETLEELFRARFTSVQRVPKSALKS